MIAQNGDRALVLRNETPDRGGALVVRLRGTTSNPQGFGARVELHAADRVMARWMKSSTSYLSQGPPEIHFGLGDATSAPRAVGALAVGAGRQLGTARRRPGARGDRGFRHGREHAAFALKSRSTRERRQEKRRASRRRPFEDPTRRDPLEGEPRRCEST